MAQVKASVNISLDVTGNYDNHRSRKFTLRSPSYAIRVGRGSRNGDKDLMPTPDNAWFESRVMSREHAVFKASPDMKAVFLEDIGSMHGTFVNERRLLPREQTPLATGDTIRFGAEVSRGSDTFPPLRATFLCTWNDENRGSLAEDIQSVFEVEDDSESEVEIVRESVRVAEAERESRTRTFSVPDSELSAAGSFDSDDDDDNESLTQEVDNYLPSSARTMMKELKPTQQEDQPTTVTEEMASDHSHTSQEQQVAGIAPGVIPETVPESFVADTTVESSVSKPETSSKAPIELEFDTTNKDDIYNCFEPMSDVDDNLDDPDSYDSDSLGSEESDIPESEIDDLLLEEQRFKFRSSDSTSADPFSSQDASAPNFKVGMHTSSSSGLPTSSPAFRQDFSSKSRSPRAPSPSDAAMPKSKTSGNIYCNKSKTAVPPPTASKEPVAPSSTRKYLDPFAMSGHTPSDDALPLSMRGVAYNPWAVTFNPSLNTMPNLDVPYGDTNNWSVGDNQSSSKSPPGPYWIGKDDNAQKIPSLHESATTPMVRFYPSGSQSSYQPSSSSAWDHFQHVASANGQGTNIRPQSRSDYHEQLLQLIAFNEDCMTKTDRFNGPNTSTVKSTTSPDSVSQPWQPSRTGYSTLVPSSSPHTAKDLDLDFQVEVSPNSEVSKPRSSGLKRKAETLEENGHTSNDEDVTPSISQDEDLMPATAAVSSQFLDDREEKSALQLGEKINSSETEKEAPTSSVLNSEQPPNKKVKTGYEKSRPGYAKYAAFTAVGALIGAASMFGTLLALPQDLFAP